MDAHPFGHGHGRIVADGQGKVDVIVARHVNTGTEYLHVNRIYMAIVGFRGVGAFEGWHAICPRWLNDVIKAILSVPVYVLSGCNLLPAITKCSFPLMWGSLLKGLARESFFEVIVNQFHGGYFEVDEDEAVKMIAHTYYHRDARQFPAGWDPCYVLNHDAHGNVESFVGAVRLTLNEIRGAKGNLLCPTHFSLRQQCTRATTTL